MDTFCFPQISTKMCMCFVFMLGTKKPTKFPTNVDVIPLLCVDVRPVDVIPLFGKHTSMSVYL